jgi:single stranded DNA-binding protein
MSQFVNSATIQGILGSDPVVKPKRGGKFVIFPVSTEVEYLDGDGIHRKLVEWHNIAVFDDFVTVLARGDFKKGDFIRIEGEISTTSWEGKDEKTNYKTQILVKNPESHKIIRVEKS